MEKAFALSDHHFPDEGRTAIYNTLDHRVVMVIFLKKADWPNREKEEVFRCPACKGFIFSRTTIRSRGKDYKHFCKGIPVARAIQGEEKEASNDTGTGIDASPDLA